VIITFSHFLPRIVGPLAAQESFARSRVGQRTAGPRDWLLESALHVYGHSDVNRHTLIGGIRYIRNASGYPYDIGMARTNLVRIYEHIRMSTNG
jgi:hypothetical protein